LGAEFGLFANPFAGLSAGNNPGRRVAASGWLFLCNSGDLEHRPLNMTDTPGIAEDEVLDGKEE
jgi:hypothetical protein